MSLRCQLVLLWAAALGSMGASYRSQNFVADGPTPQIAQQIAQYAENYRREKAIQWLGQEMPAWGEPCPVHAKVMMSGAGGATSFAFDQGKILSQDMHIEGSLERLLNSVLPHEVTHTVFAYYFRCPVPRWADEGGAVLSEDDIERNRHDKLCRDILNTPSRAMPLRRLFALKEYPNDVMVLYAQGYSVCNFLVNSSSRQAFLAFIAHGMQHGWDSAVQTHYRYRTVEELEQAWLANLRATRRAPAQLAANTGDQQQQPQPIQSQIVVRQTNPPVQPIGPQPVVRGANPLGDADDRRPQYLPDYQPRAAPTQQAAAGGWQQLNPPPGNNQGPPAVRLGPPQYLPGTQQ